MTDELLLPQVPEAIPEDPEDVSWALSTAEAMWARGDHLEGIKWVRRAAEAASEAEIDNRALQLAKAAADLTGLISRMSINPHDEPAEEIEPEPEPEPFAVIAPPPVPPSRPSFSASPSKVPPAPSVSPGDPKPQPPSVTKQVATPSRPPAPLPSRASQAPAAPAAGRGKPLGTNTTKTPSMRPGAMPKQGDNLSAKKKRRSPEGLEAFTGAMDQNGPPAVTAAVDVPVVSTRIKRPEVEPVREADGRKREFEAKKPSAFEWDAVPTADLKGDLLDSDRIALSPASQNFARTSQSPALVPAAPTTPQRSGPPSVAPHDPGITTSQAVRVVVWRDANGVHVAPAGTVVSAITVDAVLVALEPSADLTAWLSSRPRP